MVHWIGSILVGGVDDLQEFVRVQGSAADQAAVHVLLGQQGLGVGFIHGAAVLDGGGAGDAGPVELAQDAADGPADLPGLLRGGGVAGADGPDGLIGDDDPAHILRGDPGQGCLELVGDELHGHAQLPLVLVLTHAENGAEPGAEGGVDFLIDDVVRLAEEDAAFAVADDDVFHV